MANSPALAPRPVDGAWSEWSKPPCSPCTCAPFTGGLGVLQSMRTCSYPSPSNGGRDCTGDIIRGIVCNADCPATSDTVDYYINRQCEWRRSQGRDPEMTGKGAQLLRYDGRACKVFCDIRSSTGVKNYRFYGDLIPDGTPCGSGRYCLNGQCLTLSCDNSGLVGDPSSCPTCK